MVTIIGYKEHTNKAGEVFISLQLQGDLVMVQSAESGKYYATAKKCSITSTFEEEQAKVLVGTQMAGRIEKVACEDYEYTVEETGEVVTLSHRWEFLPEGVPTPLRAVSSDMAA